MYSFKYRIHRYQRFYSTSSARLTGIYKFKEANLFGLSVFSKVVPGVNSVAAVLRTRP